MLLVAKLHRLIGRSPQESVSCSAFDYADNDLDVNVALRRRA